MSFHVYADDTQIYLLIKTNDLSALRCLDEVKIWLAQKYLLLNEDKTEVIVVSPSDHSQATRSEQLIGLQIISCVKSGPFE